MTSPDPNTIRRFMAQFGIESEPEATARTQAVRGGVPGFEKVSGRARRDRVPQVVRGTDNPITPARARAIERNLSRGAEEALQLKNRQDLDMVVGDLLGTEGIDAAGVVEGARKFEATQRTKPNAADLRVQADKMARTHPHLSEYLGEMKELGPQMGTAFPTVRNIMRSRLSGGALSSPIVDQFERELELDQMASAHLMDFLTQLRRLFVSPPF